MFTNVDMWYQATLHHIENSLLDDYYFTVIANLIIFVSQLGSSTWKRNKARHNGVCCASYNSKIVNLWTLLDSISTVPNMSYCTIYGRQTNKCFQWNSLGSEYKTAQNRTNLILTQSWGIILRHFIPHI